MASIRVDGYDIPLVFPIGDGGRARVPSHLLHVRFRFLESSIYVEEEQRSESGDVVQSIPVGKAAKDGTYAWYLPPGNYRAYGLPLSMLAASTEIHSRQSHNSTVDMPCSPRALLRSPPTEGLGVPHTSAIHPVVKVERLDPIIELSSEFEEESPNINGQKRRSSICMASGKPGIAKSMSTILVKIALSFLTFSPLHRCTCTTKTQHHGLSPLASQYASVLKRTVNNGSEHH